MSNSIELSSSKSSFHQKMTAKVNSCLKLYFQTTVLFMLILTSVFLLSLSTIGREKKQRLTLLLQLAEENDLCQALDLSWVNNNKIIKDYQCEYHDIETKDGYLLRLKRIYPIHAQDKENLVKLDGFKFNVLLVPGLGDSSSTWAMSGRKQSLVGTLLDMNQTQIWLLDPRGRVPLIHRNFTGDQHEFWDFSFDEKVEFDLPSTIDYILRVTNKQQIDAIVGHSQGGLLILAHLTASATSGTQKVSKAYFYAPPLAGWNPSYALMREGLVYPLAHHLLPNKNIAEVSNRLRQFLSIVCLAFPGFCRATTCLVAGCGQQSVLDPHKLSEILTFYPSATSLKNVEHLFHCERQAGLIRNYLKGNHFMVENFTQVKDVPLSFYFGQNDRLVDKRRFNQGLKLLNPHAVKRYRVFDYGHADFVWGENARRLVYQDVVEDLLLK